MPLIEAAHVVNLPKGQAFALLEGGNLWKIRMPLPASDPDEVMPKDLQELAGYMRQHYVEAGDWWEGQGLPALPAEPPRALPESDVNLSAHPAPIVQSNRWPRPSVETTLDGVA